MHHNASSFVILFGRKLFFWKFCFNSFISLHIQNYLSSRLKSIITSYSCLQEKNRFDPQQALIFLSLHNKTSFKDKYIRWVFKIYIKTKLFYLLSISIGIITGDLFQVWFLNWNNKNKVGEQVYDIPCYKNNT